MSQINNPTATAISSGVIGLGLAAPLAIQASRLINQPEGVRLGRWLLNEKQLSHLLATGLGGVLLAGAGGIFLYQSVRQKEKSTSSLIGTSALAGLGVGVLSMGNLWVHAVSNWKGLGAGMLGLLLFVGGFGTAILGGVGTYYFTRDDVKLSAVRCQLK